MGFIRRVPPRQLKHTRDLANGQSDRQRRPGQPELTDWSAVHRSCGAAESLATRHRARDARAMPSERPRRPCAHDPEEGTERLWPGAWPSSSGTRALLEGIGTLAYDPDAMDRKEGTGAGVEPGPDGEILRAILRFRRLSPSQKIRATLMNNSATRRILRLGAGELRRSDRSAS